MKVQFEIDVLVKVHSDSAVCIEATWTYFHHFLGGDTKLIDSFVYSVDSMNVAAQVGLSSATVRLRYSDAVMITAMIDGVNKTSPIALSSTRDDAQKISSEYMICSLCFVLLLLIW